MKRKKSHGGKRKGAGRPKKEKTKVMRIPVSKVEEVKKIITEGSKGTARRCNSLSGVGYL